MSGFTIPIFNAQGEPQGTHEVPVSVFGGRVLLRTLHQVVVMYEANRRVGTHSTKTRSEVRGPNRKIWRQKGTGRARMGTKKSPLWRGGGIIHGPKPRDYSFAYPLKIRRAALRSALFSKVRDHEMAIIELPALDAPKTKTVANLLATLERPQSLIVFHAGGAGTPNGVSLSENDQRLIKSVRNLPRAIALADHALNAYEVLRHRHLLITRDALEALMARLGEHDRTSARHAREADHG